MTIHRKIAHLFWIFVLVIVFSLLATRCVFGTVIVYEQSEADSSTTETSWQDKLVVTRSIDAEGDYLFWYSAEIAGVLTNKAVAMRATLDGTEISRMNKIPNDAGEWYCFAGIRGAHLTAGPHTFKIQFAVESSNQTATARRARVTVHKH